MAKYAHAMDDDVRAALESAEKSRKKSRTSVTRAGKGLKTKGKGA